ncbi:murein transglycosylase [Nostoc cf. commune SO-36]|uniref:peptidoglycan lytic exotransglycosylase n=1 Tax=Nostoc cf. commune SO-36 TaxID=449208 RepID=A0ABM7Z3F2_NOSCO|nr:MltA domain-containing protein [Nostoc commune]BDI17522.1 murein transglycosylase [Nostoc cf. commune SO-36]
MKKGLAGLGKFNKAIAISLPVVLSVLLVRMQSLTHRELISPECRVKKWDIPLSLTAENQDALTQKQKVPLIQRLPVTCCQSDTSCLDEILYGEIADKKAPMSAIARSLQYLETANAKAAYQNYPVVGITRDRVFKSLQRFRELLLKTNSATEYRYPVYRLPADFKFWPKPHPTREELEGADGLQSAKGKLRGLELFWFRDRFEPYLAQIQGSAKLQLSDGTQTTIGSAGNTAYNYKSIGRELVNDGKLPLEGVTMPIILDYFQQHPPELNIYIPRDRSFVFFQENHGQPAQGSINVPLTAERSIATDKSLMPPGALALIRASIPFVNPTGKMEERIISRYVLDQDTGGAIKGAGRVDYFLGTGKLAGDAYGGQSQRAGVTVSNGELFYLLLKSKN